MKLKLKKILKRLEYETKGRLLCGNYVTATRRVLENVLLYRTLTLRHGLLNVSRRSVSLQEDLAQYPRVPRVVFRRNAMFKPFGDRDPLGSPYPWCPQIEYTPPDATPVKPGWRLYALTDRRMILGQEAQANKDIIWLAPAFWPTERVGSDTRPPSFIRYLEAIDAVDIGPMVTSPVPIWREEIIFSCRIQEEALPLTVRQLSLFELGEGPTSAPALK